MASCVLNRVGVLSGESGALGRAKGESGSWVRRPRGKEDTPGRSKGSPEEGPREELGVGLTGIENVGGC